MSSGTTVVELIIGVLAGAIIALATAMLVKAGVSTYTYCMRQNKLLENSRNALVYGDAGRPGLVYSGRSASSVLAVAPSNVTYVMGGVQSGFSLQGRELWRSYGLSSARQADYVSTMNLGYYSMNSAGLIISAPSAAEASFVTFELSMQGAQSQKTYRFFSGAELRNHP